MLNYKSLMEKNLTCKQIKIQAHKYGIYADSVSTAAGTLFFIARADGEKRLVAQGSEAVLSRFEGEDVSSGVKECYLNTNNCKVMREYFPYMSPSPIKGHSISIGLGDRLGVATPGHLRIAKKYPIFPVVAQQSMRELTLTGRTYDDVLTDASWAVFQEGYKRGFGADGDHLKSAKEIEYALGCGYTMITLDCSETIDNGIYALSPVQTKERYMQLDEGYRNDMEAKYLGKNIVLRGGTQLENTEQLFYQTVLVYKGSIELATSIYHDVIKKQGRHIDFEVSLDETLSTTHPLAHYIVAAELSEKGVDIASLAPRFVGEFQKGIDYIGDVCAFEKDFAIHSCIADHFGYKISVHSGSDKFTVFPVVGRITNGNFHLKTAGTNWLEFVRMVAIDDPSLFRRLYKFAVRNFEGATAHYRVNATLDKFPDIDKMADEELPNLFETEMVHTRQLMHITYGYILNEKHENESYAYKDSLYKLAYEKESSYYNLLEKHIGRHIQTLGIQPY